MHEKLMSNLDFFSKKKNNDETLMFWQGCNSSKGRWWWCFLHLYFFYRSVLRGPSDWTNDQNLMVDWGRKTRKNLFIHFQGLGFPLSMVMKTVRLTPPRSSSLLGCLQFTVFRALKYSEAFLSVFRLRCSVYLPLVFVWVIFPAPEQIELEKVKVWCQQ